MSRRISALSAALFALVALPASAGATTFTVDPAAAAGCNGTTCKTIKEALAAVQDGDTVAVTGSKTAYLEDPLTVAKKNVTLSATPGTVVLSGKATNAVGSNVLTLAGEGTIVRGLIVSVQENGGLAVLAAAKSTTVESSTLAKFTSTTTDVPTYQVEGAGGGTGFIKSSFIIHGPQRATPGTAPAVLGEATSSLSISDTSILAGPNGGSAVRLVGNEQAATPTPNQLIRSQLVASKSNDAHALEVFSALDDDTPKLTKVDSTTLAGGQNGAGLRAISEADSFPSSSVAGDIRVELVHATIATSTNSIQALARANGESNPITMTNDSAGNVEVVADRSIIHGSAVQENVDAGLLTAGNTSKITITNSDTELVSKNDSGNTLAVSGSSRTSDAALFVDAARKNLHLRANAPVLDKGGPALASESDRDFDGQPRLNGAATDLGADEFHNLAPIAKIKASTQLARQNEVVTLDAGESADPEAASGGGLKEYRWDFGDGTSTTTTTPTTTKAYPALGIYSVRVTVVDSFGVVAQSDPLPIAVADGVGPTVKINAPKPGKKLKRFKIIKRRLAGTTDSGRARFKTTRTRNRHKVSGTAKDDNAIAGVQLSFRLVKPASSAQAGTCRFLDKTKGTIVGRPCRKPIFFNVAVKNGVWSYRTKKSTKLRNGLYELTARATDSAGNVGTDVVRFRVVTK